jgi:hypothetical protein
MTHDFGGRISALFQRSLPNYVLGFQNSLLPRFDSSIPLIILFSRVVCDCLTEFILVVGSRKYDEFHVEIAWSMNGQYPFVAGTPHPFDSEGKYQLILLKNSTGRVRLTQLLGLPRGSGWKLANAKTPQQMLTRLKDFSNIVKNGKHADEIDNDFNNRICNLVNNLNCLPYDTAEISPETLVTDACEKIKQFALPYLALLEAAHNKNEPNSL